MNVEETRRGFKLATFKDAKGIECSIQKSSLRSKQAIWFGVNKVDPRILKKGVWEPVTTAGYQPTDINGNLIIGELTPVTELHKVLYEDRMHLSQDHTNILLEIINKFLNKELVDPLVFTDLYGSKCSIRVTKEPIPHGVEAEDIHSFKLIEEFIELGCDNANPRIWIQGWRSLIFPKGTFFTTHMFLGKDQLSNLIPLLKHFVNTGELE